MSRNSSAAARKLLTGLDDSFGSGAGPPIQGSLRAHEKDVLVPMSRRTISILLSEFATSQEERREERRFFKRSIDTDALTGLGNKRAQNRAKKSVDRNPSLSWALFDGNDFGKFNKAHSELVGDRVLVRFAHAIASALSAAGVSRRAFRQGGDEFSAILPTDRAAAIVADVERRSHYQTKRARTSLTGVSAKTYRRAAKLLADKKKLAKRKNKRK